MQSDAIVEARANRHRACLRPAIEASEAGAGASKQRDPFGHPAAIACGQRVVITAGERLLSGRQLAVRMIGKANTSVSSRERKTVAGCQLMYERRINVGTGLTRPRYDDLGGVETTQLARDI